MNYTCHNRIFVILSRKYVFVAFFGRERSRIGNKSFIKDLDLTCSYALLILIIGYVCVNETLMIVALNFESVVFVIRKLTSFYVVLKRVLLIDKLIEWIVL